MVVLGHLANPAHVCVPSIATIVEATAFSERTVRNTLRELESAGLIKRHGRTRWNGAAIPTAYFLTFVAEPRQPIVFLPARENPA